MKVLHDIHPAIPQEFLHAAWVITHRYTQRYEFRFSPTNPNVMEFTAVNVDQGRWYTLTKDDITFYLRQLSEAPPFDHANALTHWRFE